MPVFRRNRYIVKEQHGHTYKKSLNNHINITFKLKESPLSFTEPTLKSELSQLFFYNHRNDLNPFL